MKFAKWISSAAVIAAFFVATATFAETVTETTSTSSSGTVTSLTGGALIVRSETSPTPLSYAYSKTTTYVDEDGNAVSQETVKSGAPVTVYYTTTPSGLTASKVVVRRTVNSDGTTTIQEKRTTTTP